MIEVYVVVGVWLASIFIFVLGAEKLRKHKELKKMVDMISVVPVEPTPDISEPVTSFIKCFKDNPRRFKVVATTSPTCFELRDVLVGRSWLFSVTKDRSYEVKTGFSTECNLIILDSGLHWLTKEEKAAVLDAMSPHFTTERRDRLYAIQRQRLTRIYKEKE